MVIKLKSIRDPIEDSDGYRILITRYPPRTVKEGQYWHEVYSDLAPSPHLLWNFKNEIYSWEKFVDRFYYEIKQNPKAVEHIKSLYVNYVSYENCKKTVTFICFCSDESRCHRSLVKSMVEDVINFLSRQ